MIAPKTLANFLDSIAQLYEQGAIVRRIGQYVRNWLRWVRAGVEIRQVSIDFCTALPKKTSTFATRELGPSSLRFCIYHFDMKIITG
jgi:hypothetical protein